MLKKILVISVMALISGAAYSVNTLPNCGTVPGSLMPDVDTSAYQTITPGSAEKRSGMFDGRIPVQNASTGQARFEIGLPVGQSNNDPIVFPGIVGATHSHTFRGNADFVTNTKIDWLNVQNPTCSSSAEGGGENCSGYWTPTIIDTSTNKPVVEGTMLAYYKTGGDVDAQAVTVFPVGLRMVTGDPKASSELSEDGNIRFYCLLNGESNTPLWSKNIPPCENGGKIKIQITFPNCWDGVNLDSADHKSHMQHQPYACIDAAYPVRLPKITLNYWVPVTSPTGTASWRLSSDNYQAAGYNAGYSLHADWVNGWNQAILQHIVTDCLNAKLDCHSKIYTPGLRLY